MPMTFGQLVKTARIAANMKQKDLVEGAQISQKYLSEIENGHVDPRLSIVQRIAAKLSLPLDELFPRDVPHDCS